MSSLCLFLQIWSYTYIYIFFFVGKITWNADDPLTGRSDSGEQPELFVKASLAFLLATTETVKKKQGFQYFPAY